MRLTLLSSHPSSVRSWISSTLLLALAAGRLCQAIQLNLDDQASIKSAAGTVAYGMMKYYTGNNTGDVPGNLPQPYYWWEAGAMFGAMVDYYYYTNDSTYNDVTTDALLFQVGPDKDYMTPNQTKTEGNDDQGFWGMAVMAAAEQKFPDPPQGQPQWLALAQAVFNTQAARWDTQYCSGGLRWQIFNFNNGYDYKNTISNGCFFNLAARLAVYTGNQSYADWANKAWDWTYDVGLITPDYKFYDGAHTGTNCTDINKLQWTYNPGVFLLGAANMYNLTNGSDVWRTRIQGILNGSSAYFSQNPPNVMFEMQCEPTNNCDTDNYSFKAYLSRWMAASTKLAPFVYDFVMPKLRASAAAAALQCSGGTDVNQCGMKWTDEAKWDGSLGVGQQMGALEVILANLITNSTVPVTNRTGGTSQGNPGAGGNNQSPSEPSYLHHSIDKKDRVGSGILTTILIVMVVGGVWWMIV